jgi:hypothetical protein
MMCGLLSIVLDDTPRNCRHLAVGCRGTAHRNRAVGKQWVRLIGRRPNERSKIMLRIYASTIAMTKLSQVALLVPTNEPLIGRNVPKTAGRDRPVPSNQIANFPKNEHWHRYAIDESIPCDTMMPVNSFIYGYLGKA